jgi:hypothetical protein
VLQCLRGPRPNPSTAKKKKRKEKKTTITWVIGGTNDFPTGLQTRIPTVIPPLFMETCMLQLSIFANAHA